MLHGGFEIPAYLSGGKDVYKAFLPDVPKVELIKGRLKERITKYEARGFKFKVYKSGDLLLCSFAETYTTGSSCSRYLRFKN